MEKRWQFLSLVRFKCTEIIEMTAEQPNEEEVENESFFWGRQAIYDSYDYKFMRGDCPRSQPNYCDIYLPTWKEKLSLLKKEDKEKEKFWLAEEKVV